MFIERHAEGNYKTKHAETRLGSTILPCTYTYVHTQIHTQRRRHQAKEVKKEDIWSTNKVENLPATARVPCKLRVITNNSKRARIHITREISHLFQSSFPAWESY